MLWGFYCDDRIDTRERMEVLSGTAGWTAFYCAPVRYRAVPRTKRPSLSANNRSQFATSHTT